MAAPSPLCDPLFEVEHLSVGYDGIGGQPPASILKDVSSVEEPGGSAYQRRRARASGVDDPGGSNPSLLGQEQSHVGRDTDKPRSLRLQLPQELQSLPIGGL